MKRTVGRPVTFAAITVSILIACCPAFGQGPGQLNVGDVLVGTGLVNGSGVYQVWRNPGNGYSTIGNITTSDGSTAGCLPDVTWRIYGTISSPSGGFPERFAIAPSTVTGNHPVATTAAPDTSDGNVSSISFDSFGRSYVGGATDITQYVDTNVNQTSPPAEPQTLRSNGSVSIAAPYLDLLDDTDLVFTNGGAQISKLSWS